MTAITEYLEVPFLTSLSPSIYTASALSCSSVHFEAHGLPNQFFASAGTAAYTLPTFTVGNGIDFALHTITCRYSVVATVSTGMGVLSITSHSSISIPTSTIIPSNQTANWASPSPSLASESTSLSENGSHGLSAGAAAGIGVGLAVLGLLVGTAMAWWLLSRRRRREKESDLSNDKTIVTPMLHPGQLSKTLSTLGGSSVGPPVKGTKSELDFFLVDGISDSEITSELTALGHLLTDHVENNYHLQQIQQDASAIKDSLSGLGLDEWTESRIATLSVEPRTRHVAIRNVLANVIFTALDVRNIRGLSLLPPEMVAFVRSLPPRKSIEPGTPYAKALETWRRISTFLMHEPGREGSPLPLPSRITPQVNELQTSLDQFLGYFVHDDSRARFDQSRNLDGVIRECAALGYNIFCHPCEWRYSFMTESPKDIVVLPGLERLSRREEEMYDSPRVLAWPVVVTI